jgi:hypothetical protein
VNKIETGPESGQELIHCFLVKLSLPVTPELQPEMVIVTRHDRFSSTTSDLPSGSDNCGSFERERTK